MKKQQKPKYPGIQVTTNGNQLVSYYTEARIAEAGIFYPITPSTEMGENFQMSFANGELNVFGDAKIAIEAEGEHAAQGGAIAMSLTGKRVVNFTSGQGIVYGCEQYYHAPGKMSSMVLEVSARALTRHALNVHCGHDDIYSVLDTGWTILFGKDAQQAADQSLILRKVNELALTPGINVQDGFLTSHLERTFLKSEADLIREFLGRSDDMIDCPTDAQKELFGPKRRRVVENMSIKNPILLGPVQNQEHYMNGVVARRNNFVEPILGFLENAYQEFAELTGRQYGLISSYNCEEADTVFVALGSAAENIEAVVDYIKAKKKKNVGVIHVNVIRPFPEKAIIEALRGKERVIILERCDDQMAGENPLCRDIRTALSKALTNSTVNAYEALPSITAKEMPRIFTGVYGLGSRDFRPEGILGAYEFCLGKGKRQDGKTAKDGVSFFYVGVNHPYAVISKETPSCLPDKSIAIRFHSIGGWGAITTGKNLGEIIGDFSRNVAARDKILDEDGNLKDLYHISANPKYGSEKKGAPTSYFLVAAPERVRVNCDLQHVNVVLCCDPKAFTHTNPIEGMAPGGAFIFETSETESDKVWELIPKKYRKEILDKKIRIFGINGFKVAHDATDRVELQFRMQGNTFLGAFFKVSSFLSVNKILDEAFLETVEAQYNKKFGRFGKAVVESNMKVMKAGFEKVWEVKPGAINAKDKSSMRGTPLLPLTTNRRFGKNGNKKEVRGPLYSLNKFNGEFRSDYGYHQPASPLAATGAMVAATASTNSKFVSRRMVPQFDPAKCVQCMSCITACPDTAMPNTAQDMTTVMRVAIENYVSSTEIKEILLEQLPTFEEGVRMTMRIKARDKRSTPLTFAEIFKQRLDELLDGNDYLRDHEEMLAAELELENILKVLPVSYAKIKTLFDIPEKKQRGSGGVFMIFINELCKGCGECVLECGTHNALKMVPETEEVNVKNNTAMAFLDLLPETDQRFLGKYTADNPMVSRSSVLHNHLMIRSNYEAFAAGDGSCAGCGEKSILRAAASLTEAYMRPLYLKKAERLEQKANLLKKTGKKNLTKMQKSNPSSFIWWTRTVKHKILGLGGENEKDSLERIERLFEGEDTDLIDALEHVLRQDAFNHKSLQAVDGRYDNGMSVMMMGGCTGCNSVYGSTHPNNPHTYPWMNSLFQDAPTTSWLFGESLIMNHAQRSVIPERLVDHILKDEWGGFTNDHYFNFTHFDDSCMTELEIEELPKVWAVGGDGALGDIGFQNLSKVTLQNRPNVQILMLDTQVYSNTGGQNSDSSVMPGGIDMNQAGAATEGKITERKEVARILMNGHGSPYVAHISIANAASFYQAVLDGIHYRGTAYIQAYTSCQPEHGVPDDSSAHQARLVRDSRVAPEFICNPALGETFHESLSLAGNPDRRKDWKQKMIPDANGKYNYTTAHWAYTEGRFRKHFFNIKQGEEHEMTSLDEKMKMIVQQDIVNRRYLNPTHRSYIPKNSVYTMVEKNGEFVPVGLSRQMVLFCVERRKNWRMLQNMTGIENEDYADQKKYMEYLYKN